MKIKHIRIKNKDDNSGLFDEICPLLICELCNHKIEHKKNWREGMLYWKNNLEENIIAHKECMNAIKEDDNLWPNSQELEDFFFYLLHNSGIKAKHPGYEF